jgi:hypothetical protein
LTITASIIDKNAIKPTDFSNPVNIRKEMVQNPEEYCLEVYLQTET